MTALEGFATDHTPTVLPLLLAQIQQHAQTPPTSTPAPDHEDDTPNQPPRPLPLVDLLACLTALLRHASVSTLGHAAQESVPALCVALQPHHPWAARAAAAGAITAMVGRVGETGEIQGGQHGYVGVTFLCTCTLAPCPP